MHALCNRTLDLLSFALVAAITATTCAEMIPVRHPQGSAHGFLALKNKDGTVLAVGDVVQAVHAGRVTSRLTFRFRDGSLDDDTTVFTQRGTFRLISDHHIQRGPSFPSPIDMSVDAVTGTITSQMPDGQVNQEHLDLPEDVSNGLPPNLLLSLLPTDPETRISFVVPSSKPSVIHVSIRPAGQVPFSIGDTRRMATDFVLHVEIGGLVGAIAPLIGKQPADYHIWILSGSPPAFIREEGQFYEGGPIWHVEQISPAF